MLRIFAKSRTLSCVFCVCIFSMINRVRRGKFLSIFPIRTELEMSGNQMVMHRFNIALEIRMNTVISIKNVYFLKNIDEIHRLQLFTGVSSRCPVDRNNLDNRIRSKVSINSRESRFDVPYEERPIGTASTCCQGRKVTAKLIPGNPERVFNAAIAHDRVPIFAKRRCTR